jgi:hypothetical protein
LLPGTFPLIVLEGLEGGGVLHVHDYDYSGEHRTRPGMGVQRQKPAWKAIT